MEDRYFKKSNGVIIKYGPQYDLENLMERFTECDSDGNELKKEKSKKESKKKAGK
tara:strand:- start:102 stop:266 length:165 start_codon:yes stop_codon:yes gene_type:complete